MPSYSSVLPLTLPNSILVFFCRFQAINFMNSHLNVYASDKYNEKKTKPVGQNLFRET